MSLDTSEMAGISYKAFFTRVMVKWEYDKLWDDTPLKLCEE